MGAERARPIRWQRASVGSPAGFRTEAGWIGGASRWIGPGLRLLVWFRGGDSPVIADVTQILAAAESGDPNAATVPLPLVYVELRKLAAARLVGGFRDVLELRAADHKGITLVRPDGYIAFSSNGHAPMNALESVRDLVARQTGVAQA